MNTETEDLPHIVHDIVRNMNLGVRLLRRKEHKDKLAEVRFDHNSYITFN